MNCPRCGGSLFQDDRDMACRQCGRRYYADKPEPMVSEHLNNAFPSIDLELDDSERDCGHPPEDRVIGRTGKRRCRGCVRAAFAAKRAKIALLNDGKRTPDVGCQLAPSCRGCPFLVCKHDDSNLLLRIKHRNQAASADFSRTVEEEAERLKMDIRTVYRWRKRAWELRLPGSRPPQGKGGRTA